MKFAVIFLGVLVLFSCSAAVVQAAPNVPRWGQVEFTFSSHNTYANPFTDVEFFAIFSSPSGAQVKVRSFYAGDNEFKVRFMPTEEGKWKLTTSSSPPDRGLNHQRRSFLCTKAESHGPIQVDPEHRTRLQFADGTPYLHVGDTVYNFFCHRQSPAQLKAFIDQCKQYEINKFRVLLWDWQPDVPHPFVTDASGKPDYTRFNLSHYEYVEKLLRQLEQADINVGLILQIARPRISYGQPRPDQAAMERYVRYSIARLASFRNVYWELQNEFGHPAQPKDTKNEAYLRHFAELVRAEDPSHHLLTCSILTSWRRSSHKWFDALLWHDKINKDYQREYRTMLELYKREVLPYQMPGIHDEIAYEQNPKHTTFIANGTSSDTIRREMWLNYVAGVYWTYGAGPDRWLGLVNGEDLAPFQDYIEGRQWEEHGYVYVPHLVDTLQRLPFQTMTPHEDLLKTASGAHCLADMEQALLVYFPDGGKAQVKVPTGRWKVTWVNPRTGECSSGPEIEGGTRTFACPGPDDWALVIEKQR